MLDRGARIFLLALIGAIAAGPAAAQVAAVRYIQVEGVGEAVATPDTATVSVGVGNRAASARAAMADNADAMAQVLDALKRAGVPERAVRTSQLSVFPIYDQSKRNSEPAAPVAYQASNQVSVRIGDLGRIGPIIDAMVAAGANQIHGVHFAIADLTPLEDEARRQAIADARRKATLFAEAAGVAVGRVLWIEEGGGGGGGPTPRMLTLESARATAVAPGEQTIRAAVSARFAIME